MIPASSSSPKYPDSSSLTQNLEDKTKKGPRKESVAIRTFLFSSATLLGIIGSQRFFDLPFISFPVGALIAAGGGLLYWYGWKNRIERLVIKIQEALNKKWRSLMEKKINELMRKLLPKYVSLIDEMIPKVDDASCRLRELIDYFENKHKAPSPSESAFWIYALKGREEVGEYSEMIDADISTVASEYLLEEKLLELWNRISPSGSSELNPWEWELVEKAGLKLIPHTQKLLNLSICEVLRDFPEKSDNFSQLFMRLATPFLKIEQAQGDIRGTFEISEEEICRNLYNKLRDSVKGYFSNIEKNDSLTVYRLSLFSFFEGANLDSVNKER